MDIIFKTGMCTKAKLYDTIIDLFKEGGWATPKSTASPTQAFNLAKSQNVLTSNGESGKLDLYLHIRWWDLETNLNTLNDVKTTNSNMASIRLLKQFDFEINRSGTYVQTYTRAKEPYVPFMLAPDKLDLAAIIEYKYHVNKDRLILILYYPSWTNFKSVVHYIGIPDGIFLDNITSNEILYASSLMQSTDESDTDFCWVIDAPYGWTAKTLAEKNFNYSLLPPKNPNASSKYMLSKSYYGTEAYGVRGEFSGLYLAKDENIYTKEVIKIEDKHFEVCTCHELEGYVNSFGSTAIAYQIDKNGNEQQLLKARISLESSKLKDTEVV